MAELHILGKDGTPRGRHLFATFADGATAGCAEEELAAEGIKFIHLYGAGDADGLKHSAAHSPLWRIERILKNIGGESHEAHRYAKHLEDGQVVVALAVRDRQSALEISHKLTLHGAYDVTYYTGWTIEHTSCVEDSLRGFPTYTTTNTEDLAGTQGKKVIAPFQIVRRLEGRPEPGSASR
jgi:hypothetical protein